MSTEILVAAGDSEKAGAAGSEGQLTFLVQGGAPTHSAVGGSTQSGLGNVVPLTRAISWLVSPSLSSLQLLAAWLDPAPQPSAPKHLVSALQQTAQRLTLTLVEKTKQLETAYGKLDDLREEHEEAVHGLQFQLSQQHKVISGLQEQVQQLRGHLHRPRCHASTQAGSKTVEAGCQASAATVTSAVQTTAPTSSACSQPGVQHSVPSKPAVVDAGTQFDPAQSSSTHVKPTPAASEEQLSSESLKWDLQVLTGKFQRAMDSKVEAEERALRAETRAAQQEHELAQACALAQFYKGRAEAAAAAHEELRHKVERMMAKRGPKTPAIKQSADTAMACDQMGA